MKDKDIRNLTENSSLSETEANEFLNILVTQKTQREKLLTSINDETVSDDEILEEFYNNWSAHENYEEAWKDEQQYLEDDEIIEEEFKEHAFVLSTGRCLVRTYK
jgi:predicted RND superfamily exporter protein